MGCISVDEAYNGWSNITSETTITGPSPRTRQHYVTSSLQVYDAGVTNKYILSYVVYTRTNDHALGASPTVATVGLTGTSTGSSGAHSHTITPPYYSLIYLVKLP